MANPKYVGLPGIAPPDEKDVYETDDLPEADQDAECVLEEESEYIDRPHLDVVSAHSKFKDKKLIGGKGLDFSDKYRRRKHTGYEAVSGDWEIAAEGEEETLIQRYNRLQCEVKALIEDINKLKAQGAGEKMDEVEAAGALISELENSLQQLNNCMNLTDSIGIDFAQSLSDPHGSQIKKIVAKLDELKELGESKKESNDIAESGDGMLTYQLKTYPAQNKFLETTRIASLEERVNKLEKVIGTTPENLKRLQLSEYKSLSQAAYEMCARLSLLDVDHVDKIDSKLGNLLEKMDSIAEKRGGQEFLEKEAKINELYEFLGKSEALSESVEPIIERMTALKSLHVEAADFKNTLKEIEADQANIESSINSNEQTLKKIEEAMKEHVEMVMKNIQAFDSRLAALKK